MLVLCFAHQPPPPPPLPFFCNDDQEGSTESDFMKAAATFDDGAVVLAGYTSGDWHTRTNGGDDFAAIKLDTDGSVLWKWQVDGFKSHKPDM